MGAGNCRIFPKRSQPLKENVVLTLPRLTYAELVHVINTSSDVKFLEACLREFHQRLQLYNAWEIENGQRTTRNENAEASAPVENEEIAPSTSQYDFSKWTYSELRDIINTSPNIERVEACRQELLGRVGTYNDLMSKNSECTSKDANLEISQTVTNQQAAVSESNHDLSRWNYFELRSTIESSSDVELVKVCRQELLCRLKDYSTWISLDITTKEENTKISQVVENKEAANNETKHDLSKWKYSEIRDVINNSTDIELVEACLRQLLWRYKVYYDWKTKTNKHTTVDKNKNILHQEQSSLKDENVQRYFRIPIVGAPWEALEQNTGWWYIHFDSQYIARQMELHPDKPAILLVAGKDDMQMWEVSLNETGLTRKHGAEILEEEFNKEWETHNGQPYVRPAGRNFN